MHSPVDCDFERTDFLLPFCKRTLRGAVQWRRAENIAIGPNFLNGSSTFQFVKSGPVRESLNLGQAEKWIFLFVDLLLNNKLLGLCTVHSGIS